MGSVHQREWYTHSWALTTLAAGARFYISHSSLDDAMITHRAEPCVAAVLGSRAGRRLATPSSSSWLVSGRIRFMLKSG